ncbi:MAG: 16S rRNA processing protein RimM [Lachnospiraceae bacterium]|nr:16S rRNA processing protein RimM [Lachnospiraceae bacterium]
MEEYLRIGVVTSPHGIRGEVNVYPTTDDPARFTQVNPVYVETRGIRAEHTIDRVKYFKGMAILKLSGVDSRTEAEGLRQAEILIHRSQSPKVPGQYLICDLLGMSVVREDGSAVGTVEDVLETAAHSVFSVRTEGGKEVLVPNVPAFILDVSEADRRMTVRLIPGMED